MGQALQKLRGGGAGGGGAALRAAAPPRQHASHNIEPARPSPSPSPSSSPSSSPLSAPSPQTVRQSVEVKPQAPEPQRIIEPELIKGEWDRGDPKYSMMVQQVVGKISTRPGGNQEMGNAHVTAEFRRPKPANRHTSAATGPDEEHVVATGTLNLAGIQEALRLYQGLGEGQEKPLDVKTLAAKFNVDAVLLEKVLLYTSLPVPSQESQNPPQKLRA
ncbi:hypothetical protein M758_6G018100 [Ceratodon purpureus]|nr:hypothetical protein M758_6G018100 [Ceratodon purpureus]